MKAFVVAAFCVLIAVTNPQVPSRQQNPTPVSTNSNCSDEVTNQCNKNTLDSNINKLCNPTFGSMVKDDVVLSSLQKYVNSHLIRSYEYLLMSTHFANYEMNRPGFEKLFRGLSDEKWAATQDLIGYITKRGGEMNFKENDATSGYLKTYEDYELQSVSQALDIEKKLADTANHIHHSVISKSEHKHDADLGHYIEEEFSEKHTSNIRKLSGYLTDLIGFIKEESSHHSLALYLFDEYLQKQ